MAITGRDEENLAGRPWETLVLPEEQQMNF